MLRSLSGLSRWLIVFDDLPDMEAMPVAFPAGGDVLVTSQSHAWPGIAVVNVEPLDKAESGELFARLSGQRPDADSHLASVVRSCAGLPLAISQLAGYSTATGMAADRLDRLMRERRAEVLSRRTTQEGLSLVASVQLSKEQLTEDAKLLLEVLCSFAAAPIRLKPVEEMADEFPVFADELLMEDAIAALRRLSLIERDSDAVSVHELVREIVMSGMGRSRQAAALMLASPLLNQVSPPDPSREDSWPEFERVLPHMEHLVRLLQDNEEVDPILLGHLTNRLAIYLQWRGDLTRAEEMLSTAIQAIERRGKYGGRGLGSLYTNLGTFQQERGDLAAAEVSHRRALALKEADRDEPDEVLVAISASALGVVRERIGETLDAQRLYSRALTMYLAAGDVPRAADAMQDLSRLASNRGDEAEALASLERSRRLAETDPSAWVELCAAYEGQAHVHADAARWDDAYRAASKAIEIAQEHNPGPRLASAFAMRAAVNRRSGNFEAAIEDGERALDVFRVVEPSGGLETAKMLGDLGATFIQAYRVAEGVSCLLESHDQIVTRLPQHHHTVRISFGLLQKALDFCGNNLKLRDAIQDRLGQHSRHDF